MNEAKDTRFAKALRTYMKKNDLTIDMVSEKTGTDRTHVSRILNEKVQSFVSTKRKFFDAMPGLESYYDADATAITGDEYEMMRISPGFKIKLIVSEPGKIPTTFEGNFDIRIIRV